ncbi:MAG: hypothetical protein WAN36_02395, partial [Calditrichia bacterium]
MKRTILLLAFVLISWQGLHAQLRENLSAYVGAGASQPVESYLLNNFLVENQLAPADAENFNNYWNMGVNIGAGLEYHLNSYLSLQANFNYTAFTFNDNELAAFVKGLVPFQIVEFDVNRGNVDLYNVWLSARLEVPLGIISPYVSGGGGYI